MIVLWLSVLFAVSYGCNPRNYGQGSVVCVCTKDNCDSIGEVQPLTNGKYVMYTSSMAGLRFEKTYGTFEKIPDSNPPNRTVYINRSRKFQHIFGFGGAFTDSACKNVLSLSEETRNTLMNQYYADDGIQYSLGRIPIAGTDFSDRAYTYADEEDEYLSSFSLQPEDTQYKIPIIHQALELTKGDLKIFGTAWTAPPWMKTNNRYAGVGLLKRKYYKLWAVYHKKFLDAYRANNISMWGLTTGNEPANGLTQYININDMGWNPIDHAVWIAQLCHLLKFNYTYKDVKIMIVDDQRVYIPWIAEFILQNKLAYECVDGLAVHYYTDQYITAEVLSDAHYKFPDKFILATEGCEGPLAIEPVILGSWERAENYLSSIIDDLNNWVTGWVDWNIALDPNGGPTYIGNYVDSPIIVNATADEFLKQPMFYAMGHFSKFVRPGSKRIYSSNESNLKTVVLRRPDGGIVVQVFNPTEEDLPVGVYEQDERRYINVTIPKRSMNTILYW